MAPDTEAAALLAGWREATEAATPGEWRAVAGLWATDGGKQEIFPAVIASDGDPAKAGTWLMAAGRGSPNPESNAQFAAMARTAMPRLLAAVRRLSELADEWDAKAAEIGAQVSLCEGATAGFKMIGYQTHRNHAAALREAITAALTGTQLEER